MLLLGGGGDFNADPLKGRFWKLLREFCDSMSLHILQDFLPSDAFTYLCPTRNTTSWLDHFICSNKFKDNVMNVSVNYETALYDHFPITVVLSIPIHLEHFKDNDKVICNYVNWNKMTHNDKEDIKNYIESEIIRQKLLESNSLLCFNPNCENESHREELDSVFNANKCILIQSTEKFRYMKERRFKVIPGWNDYVREFHTVARENFLLWKENGRPQYGKLCEGMKVSRSKFRSALNTCRENEVDIRNKKLLDNFKNKDKSSFWGEVAKVNNHNLPVPAKIDGKCSNYDISNLFSNKYKEIFSRNKKSKFIKMNLTSKMKVEILMIITFDDIKKNIKFVRDTVGYDNIHTNHLKFSSSILNDFIAKLFTSFIIHGHVPVDMIRGIINPLIKDRLGDCHSSSNYRPIIVSSVSYT